MPKHRVTRLETSKGQKWGIRCKYEGNHYLFRYVYDKLPSERLLASLDNGNKNTDWQTNIAANYWNAANLRGVLTVERPTTAKDYWHILSQ